VRDEPGTFRLLDYDSLSNLVDFEEWRLLGCYAMWLM
jgi:hypothetical protein